MSRSEQADGRDGAAIGVRDPALVDGVAPARIAPERPDGRPRVLVRPIGRTALVRFANAEILFDEDSVRAVGDRLDRLVAEEGYTHLLLDLRGVRYVSGAMLGRLAALQQKLVPVRGRTRLTPR